MTHLSDPVVSGILTWRETLLQHPLKSSVPSTFNLITFSKSTKQQSAILILTDNTCNGFPLIEKADFTLATNVAPTERCAH